MSAPRRPMNRLTEYTVCSGSSTRTRLAAAPTTASAWAAGKCTTDGVKRRPSASAMTNGMPESTVATSELVVPKSMPTILSMNLEWFETGAAGGISQIPVWSPAFSRKRAETPCRRNSEPNSTPPQGTFQIGSKDLRQSLLQDPELLAQTLL